MRLQIRTGQIVRLRPLRRADAAALARLANDKTSARFLPHVSLPFTVDDARLMINSCHRAARANKAYHVAIEAKRQAQLVGMVGLKNLNLDDSNAEVEYWVGRNARRRGYATEALLLLLDLAFRELRLHRVYAIVHERNAASIRVLEKAGFIREGTWREASRIGGHWRDVYGYGLLRGECHLKLDGRRRVSSLAKSS